MITYIFLNEDFLYGFKIGCVTYNYSEYVNGWQMTVFNLNGCDYIFLTKSFSFLSFITENDFCLGHFLKNVSAFSLWRSTTISKYSNRRFATQSAHHFFPAGSPYEAPSFLAMKVALESFPNCTVKV